MLQYHFKMDADRLTDEEFAEQWQRLKYALELENKRFSLKEGENGITL